VSDWSDDGYYDVCFAVERCRRYHAKMQSFYDWCYNLTRAATALTGTASFFVLLAKGTEIAKYLTAVVATAAALDSVFRFNSKARRHEVLARRFTDLSAKIANWEPTPINLRKARAERLRIEKDEPPVRRLIDLQAQNEESRSRDLAEKDMVPLTRCQRTFGYVFTFGMKPLEDWQAQRSAALQRETQTIKGSEVEASSPGGL
jgi:hypothetical protein